MLLKQGMQTTALCHIVCSRALESIHEIKKKINPYTLWGK